MTTFNNHSAANRKAESLTGNIVNYTNEGLKINLTKGEDVDGKVASLKTVFSNVEVKGRKVKTILINYISQNVQRARVTEVTY